MTAVPRIQLQIARVNVQEPGKSWRLLLEDGTTMWLFDDTFMPGVRVVPHEGDTVTIHGSTDVGREIVGVDLNGAPLVRRTAAEGRAYRRQDLTAEQRRQHELFARDLDELWERTPELPPALRARLAFLRQTEPEVLRAWEPYELVLCLDANQVAMHLRAWNAWPEAIEQAQAARAVQEFIGLPEAERQAVVALHPAHSAQTLFAVGVLAIALLTGAPVY